MQCATCGNYNLPQAQFCGRCGTALAATGTQAAAQTEQVRLPGTGTPSAVTPVIAMLLAGLILSVIAKPVYYYYYGSLFATAFPWVWAGAGVVAAFWLSSLLRPEGRLPSVLGMILVALGSFIGVGFSLVGTYVAHGIIGVDMGLAMPPIFWRLLPSKSVGAKVALVVAVVTGLFLGNWTLVSFGFRLVYGVTSAIALLGGMPAALASPTVQAPRESRT